MILRNGRWGRLCRQLADLPHVTEVQLGTMHGGLDALFHLQTMPLNKVRVELRPLRSVDTLIRWLGPHGMTTDLVTAPGIQLVLTNGHGASERWGVNDINRLHGMTQRFHHIQIIFEP